MPDPDGATRAEYEARLLAVAAAAEERLSSQPVDDRDAVARAIARGGDFERRILSRAAALPSAPALQAAIRRVRSIAWTVTIGLAVIAALGGAGAAAAALAGEPGRPVNVYALLGGVLGLQTLLLLAWLALDVIRPAALRHLSLAGIAWGLARRLASRLSGRGETARSTTAAVAALGRVQATGATARWSLGLLSNGIWTAFNIGCLVATVALLSVRQREFCWESTILAADTYASITDAIAWLPRQVGLPAPTREQIERSQFDPARAELVFLQDEATRRAWAWLLIGGVAMYGLAPRLFLTMLSAGMLRRARRRYRLDLGRPEFSVLRSRLMPSHVQLGVVDGDDHGAEHVSASVPAAPDRPRSASPVILGLEIAPPAGGWPPLIAEGAAVEDLGIIESREQRHAALDRLAFAPEAPRRLVVVCSLCTVPDRGLASFLRDAVAASGAPVSVVLTGGAALRRRTDAAGVELRVRDWRRVAREARVSDGEVIEIDLDQPTAQNTARLSSLVRGDQAPIAGERRLESAFELIVDAAETWSSPPVPAQQAELHRSIMRLYGAPAQGRFRSLMGLPASIREGMAEPGAMVRHAAERVTTILPPALRLSPRWIAAGAAAGALGCVAMASLVFPAAIASLPLWSAMGGAIAGVLRGATTRATGDRAVSVDESGELDSDRFGDTVRSAAMTVALLELQGRTEAAIGRGLEQLFRDDDPMLGDVSDVRRYLLELRHRFDMVQLAEERR